MNTSNQTSHAGPNMTPMVDIVMCILIFFMLSMTFAGAEVFLTSNIPVSDHSSVARTSRDIFPLPQVRVEISIKPLAEGGTGVRLGAGAEYMRVGQPDSAKAENRDAEMALNDAIAANLTTLHAGMSDNALVILTPKGFVPYVDMIKVYDACVKARFATVAFAPAVD